MEADVYTRLAEQEERHWWFRARRRILKAALEKLVPRDRPLRILEAGSGTGGNLAMLGQFGEVSSFELDSGARALAATKGLHIDAGRLPDAHPFTDQTFDLIVLFDVLEHVEADLASLEALRKLLKPGGRLMLTVPAFPFLWSGHDVHHQHFRRYRRKGLRDKFEQAGYSVHRLSYYNFWLFPLIALARVLKKLLRLEHSDEEGLPPKWLNSILEILFSSERFLLPYLSFPVGVSLWAVAFRDE